MVKAVDVSCSELRTETNIRSAAPAKKLNLKKNKLIEPNLSCALKPFSQISYNEFRTQTTTVTASNLSISANKSHVIDFFKQVGDIVDVCVCLCENNSGQLRAHSAFIEFATEEAAEKAIKFHRLGLLGYTLDISLILGVSTGRYGLLVMKDVPFNTDKSDVIKFFKQAGDSVDFVSEEAARKAVKLNGLELLGSRVGLRRQAEGTGAPSTVCLKSVPLSIDKSLVIEFFEDVADVRFSYYENGTFRGNVHVEFATEEAAKEAVKLNGKDLKGCPVALGIVRETLCVQGFDTSSDQIRSILKRHFRTCRYIVQIDILKDHNAGVPLGIALINFSSLQAFHLALQLDGQEVDGTSLSIKDYVPVDRGGGAGAGLREAMPTAGNRIVFDDIDDTSFSPVRCTGLFLACGKLNFHYKNIIKLGNKSVSMIAFLQIRKSIN
ncbi:hypothetical protein MKW98_019130 [Papaver atlanticum]|uniref:RRM domain-containing protein n=1 Tax=Papaver atlanticum TaxID=357466 RepID=A0AAD4TKT4_9MAGN|nr:hypothetical protein MKW98_019130 [Papaver atlanticum]